MLCAVCPGYEDELTCFLFWGDMFQMKAVDLCGS